GGGAIAINDAIGMRENVADEHALLAGLRKFRPVVCNRRVEIDLAAVDQDVHTQCAHALDERIHDDDRVFLPRLGASEVLMAAPEIDNLLSVLVDTDGGADLAPSAEIIGKCFFNGGEFRCAGATN